MSKIDVPGQSRKQACLDQRRFPAATGAVEQADGKSPVWIGLLDAFLPEADAIGQAVAVARAGQQFEKKIGIFRIERPQTLGNDANRPALGVGGGNRGGGSLPHGHWDLGARPVGVAGCRRLAAVLGQPVPQIFRHIQGGEARFHFGPQELVAGAGGFLMQFLNLFIEVVHVEPLPSRPRLGLAVKVVRMRPRLR